MHCPNCGFDPTDFHAVLSLVTVRLQQKGRISYRALQYEFGLDEALLDALREELIFSEQVASDEDEKVLVWIGKGIKGETDKGRNGERETDGEREKRGKGENSLASRVQSLESKGKEQAPSSQTLDPRLSDPRRTAAERRQLTVMFCDLVDSTALSAKLDPEDLLEVVQAYQETAVGVIQPYDGHVAQYLGDGLLVYFGYPQAHEDDAQRAIHAGLGILSALVALNRRLQTDYGVALAVRIGVHTGPVVVGQMGGGDRHEQLALGETPNIAARLQGLAEPDTIVMSAATARLTRHTFALEELGEHSLKGIAEPMLLSCVLGLREEPPDAEETASARTLFLVGRDEEVGLLHRRWEQSKEGMGQVVLLSGEAGIGKSSLVERSRTEVKHAGAASITFRCSPYHQHSALYPIIAHLQRLLRWQPEESPAAKLDKLEQLVQASRLPVAEAVPLFAALLSLTVPAAQYPPLNLSPQRQRQQTHDLLVAWLVEEAERQPVQVTWEDVHWADPSTLEVLGLVIEQAPTVRMLNLLTYRPEFQPPWPMRSHMTLLTLNRLERLQVEALVTHLAGGTVLPAEVMQHVVSKTDGVPLFVEELTKTVLESNVLRQVNGRYELLGPLSTLAIPSTLQDSLMARLDRHPVSKEVAQLGAVLGREFAYATLKALTPLDDATLQDRLSQLVEAELLYQRGRPPRARYLFKHALIQDVAYASLLKSTRQHYHQQIAHLFAHQFPDLVETQPELLAHHYTEASLIAQAIPYWQQAGQRASQRSANVEAISHLTKGLELLKTLPDTLERVQQELTLQTLLGSSLMTIKGFGALEVEKAYDRARELCRQVGETPQLFTVLSGLRVFYLVRGKLQTEHELAEQIMRLAQNVEDPRYLLLGHIELGESLYALGEWVSAREHFEQGIALYDPRQSRLPWLWLDAGVVLLSYAAGVLQTLGYLDQASRRIHEALALAQELSHPFSLAWALNFAATLHQFGREGQAAQERAEALIVLSSEQGFPLWVAHGTVLRGWALAEQGQSEEGVAQIRHGLADYRTTGAELMRPYFLLLLAEAYGKVGQVEEGLTVLTEALAAVDKTGERFSEAELYRLKGTLTLQSKVQGLKSKVENGSGFGVRSQKLRNALRKPLRLLSASKRSRWSCAPL